MMFICKKEDGATLSLHDRRVIAEHIANIKTDAVRIEIKPFKNTRSNRQNAYYWGVVVPAIRKTFEEVGTNADDQEIHAYLKMKIGKMQRVIVSPNGDMAIVVDTTTKLSPDEFELYLEKVRVWAAELGVLIPMPNEPPMEGVTGILAAR